MHTLTEFFTRNSVAANLLMLLILLGGIFTVTGIRIEAFPRIPPNTITITVAYPGATAEQVDEGITLKLEQSLRGMPGVKKISGTSSEGLSAVMVRKTAGYDLQRLLNDAKNRVDTISGFPQLAERPVITRDEFSIEALIVQVYGETDEDTLQQAGRMVETELLAHPSISEIETFGKRSPEIHIELDEAVMRSYGVTPDHVQELLSKNSLDYRAGTLRSGGGEITLRVDQKAFHYEDFIRLPVLTLSDGRRLLLRDIATVRDGFEDQVVRTRFQGLPCIGMMINTGNRDNLMVVSDAARDVIEKLRPQLPENVQLDAWADSSIYIKDRLELLSSNAWQGLLIVFVMLALFLNPGLAFWVAMGIPISVAGTLALMGDRFLDYSLNDITTFGMIIVLGILVDDAIVVGESVFDERGKCPDPVEGTIRGVHRVSAATVFGAFTTVAAFFPLTLIDNEMGKMFAIFAIVVIVAVLFSLVESKFILPAHLAGISLDKTSSKYGPGALWAKVQKLTDGLMCLLRDRIYRPVVSWLLTHRYAGLVGLIAFATLGIGMIFTGQIRLAFFPEVPGNIITISLTMDNSSPLEMTLRNADRIEDAAEIVNARLQKKHGLETPPVARLMTAVVGRHSAEIYGELHPDAVREIGTMEILRQWREETGMLEGTETLSFSGSYETGGGFGLQVVARDSEVLHAAVREVSQALNEMDGVHDVRDDLKPGEPEIRLRLKPAARHLGLTLADLAAHIGDGFGGLEVQRMQRGTDEVKVFVRYREERRRSLHELLTSRVRTPDGEWIPLLQVARAESGYGVGSVSRRNWQRAVYIEASPDKQVISPDEIFQRLEKTVIPNLKSRYPGLEIGAGGELEETCEVKAGLVKALIFILILIYTLLAVPLKSYWQPFVIMSVVPFSFTGAVLGHLILGLPLSILSFFGMLAATGVVVNDSLVMVTRFNQLREEGMPFQQALAEAGTSRFRAIFLTTATTVTGLMPLMAETSEQARYLIPAAASLAFAELFATPVALVLIPILLNIAEDGQQMAGAFFGAEEKADVDADLLPEQS